MPKASDDKEDFRFKETLKRLSKNSNYIWGVVAQFFYVGAQIGVWSFSIRYVMRELDLYEKDAAGYYLAALILFAGSRFVFTALMRFFKPKSLLTVSSILAIIATAVVILASGLIAVYALVFISGCMSLMFPTIYGLAAQGLGKDTKIGGSGLIMAILGGAVITLFQGLISDATGSIKIAYIVPLICFVVVLIYSIIGGRKSPAGSEFAR